MEREKLWFIRINTQLERLPASPFLGPPWTSSLCPPPPSFHKHGRQSGQTTHHLESERGPAQEFMVYKKRQYSWRKQYAALCYTRAKWQLSKSIIPNSKYTIFFSLKSCSSDRRVTATAYALGILRRTSQAAEGLDSSFLLPFDGRLLAISKWHNHKDQPRPADCDDDNSLSCRR